MSSVNELSALILSDGFKLVQCGIYALFSWTKIKHRLCDEVLFIGDIKPFNGDGSLLDV